MDIEHLKDLLSKQLLHSDKLIKSLSPEDRAKVTSCLEELRAVNMVFSDDIMNVAMMIHATTIMKNIITKLGGRS